MKRWLRVYPPASWVAAIAVVFIEGSTAWAQFETGTTSELAEKPPTWAWVIGGLSLAACLVVAFKNPKRSHLN